MAATLQPGEPTPSCNSGNLTNSVWYAYTAATSGEVSAVGNFTFNNEVDAYIGTSLTSLTDLGCGGLYGRPLTIHVSAGQTYYFQVGGLFGQSGSLTFNLNVTPQPTAHFYFSPSDPSIFDTIQFTDFSNDPVDAGFTSEAWDFGDHTTGSGGVVTHRYAADGNYTVTETVTTVDGRTASTSQTVQVTTHDVAITKFSVPNTARAGQTKSITVGVSNSRYPEMVEVFLSRSVPGGFQQVGSLGPYTVPVMKANGTVPFAFSYTFTSDDATAGKVTFQATATIISVRDALPADNTAVSLPTRVTS
jgi:hypothetical protein